MVQYSNFNRAMEVENHFKNGANSKSHTSRGSLIKKVITILVIVTGFGIVAHAQTIPSWLIGTWDNSNGYLFTVSNSQIRWHTGEIADFIIVDGESVFFQWRSGSYDWSGSTCKITRVSSDRALYHNSSSGNSYVVDRRESNSQQNNQQSTQQQSRRTINAKLCSFYGGGPHVPIYYQFTTNGRVTYYEYQYYRESGRILPNSEKYKYGSYYIDDSQSYYNLIITWDNGATEKRRITWERGVAKTDNGYKDDNCN